MYTETRKHPLSHNNVNIPVHSTPGYFSAITTQFTNMVDQIVTSAVQNLQINTSANRIGNNSMNSNKKHLMLPVVQNNANSPMHDPSSIFHTPIKIAGTPSISPTLIASKEDRQRIREISNTIIPKHATFFTVPKLVKDNNGVLACVNVYTGFENHSQQLSDFFRDQHVSIRESQTVKQLSLLTKTDTSRLDYIINTLEGSIRSDYRYDELEIVFLFSKSN